MIPAAAERVEVLVLVDNAVDMLSRLPPFVQGERQLLRRFGMQRMSGAAICCAAHGLALLITAHGPGGPRRLLFDGGPAEWAIARNIARLGIEVAGIEAMVLSHGHWDHAGGLPEVLRQRRAAGCGPLPLYLHPGMFRERGSRQPDGGVLPMERVPEPAAWAGMGAIPVVTREAALLLDDLFYVSGEIPRRSGFERGLPGQVARAGEDAPWEPDELLMDERFLAVRLAGRGIVVFSACSHAGIVNVLQAAREAFPGEPLHAVIGGLHLSGENEAIIPETVAAMGPYAPRLIIPAHCTGWRAVQALTAAYGERVVPAAVGRLFTL
ncbi:MAG: MBL fold metallo-hydrolase [Rhodovarius sp.]|nr:MBL fold metallo-hydrolase [Rhodovarius sp.]MCX7933442.1 MBL fold metallo-hydrolase [Rhodovarius sp.]MDW8315696.1 MBL fold metallo-hydrolase [Rhodovarius sp.]